MLEDFREKMKGKFIEKVKGECIFCHLIDRNHEKIIYRDENIAVFPPLKSDALKDGHLLVVPVEHSKSLMDIDAEKSGEFFSSMKQFADKVLEQSRYTGFNLLNASGEEAQQSIGHLHFHLVLREEEDGFDLWPKTSYNGKNFENVNKELGNLLD